MAAEAKATGARKKNNIPKSRVNQIMDDVKNNPDQSTKARSKLQKELKYLKPNKQRRNHPKVRESFLAEIIKLF